MKDNCKSCLNTEVEVEVEVGVPTVEIAGEEILVVVAAGVTCHSVRLEAGVVMTAIEVAEAIVAEEIAAVAVVIGAAFAPNLKVPRYIGMCTS